MKFIVNSTALLKQLSGINGVIASNPILPILENFLFDLDGEQLSVTASDLQTTIVTELTVDSADSGKVAVPARILLDTLRNLPEQPVTFQIDTDTYSIELISENGHYKLSGENAVDFPATPTVNNGTAIEAPAEVVQKAVVSTLFATGTDDLRPAMTGVFFQLGTENCTFVSTDGHRLVRYRRTDIQSSTEANLIVPRKALNLLKSVLPSDNTPLTISFNSSNAFFSFGHIRMICRLIDERFPDYANAIPLNNPNQLVIERLELLSSLKRISIYANKTTHQIRLKLSAQGLQISAEDLDFSNEASETLQCEYEGENMEIGFNAKFLMEMLNNLDSNLISLELSAPNRAGLIIPKKQDANEDTLMLVMPVMLNQYV